MNLIETIKNNLAAYLTTTFKTELPSSFTFELNIEQEKQFGDISSNIAMTLAKHIKKNPKMIAEDIVRNFQHEYIEKIELAGPGFINIFLKQNAFVLILNTLISQKDAFFKNNFNKKYSYNVEFLSANPTGPIHLGNGRGGIIGDVLANVLKFLNNNVIKEYYINDAGNQINKLGMSLKIRCMQATGIAIELPEDSYHGDYLITMAQSLIQEQGNAVLNNNDAFFADYAKNKILEYLKTTLLEYGISYDVWFSEKSLHESGAIAKAISLLTAKGYTFEQDNAVWFKSTLFGDDKDRVLVKSTGEYTYTAADIAYMQNKIDRGATYMIMTLGHDHHSFAQRLHGLHQALGIQDCPLEVILYQLVKMKQNDAQVRMSKRTGNAITLKDVIDTVGTDVARFFYLHKKADAQLEFDLDLALKKTDENPVFYIQYAYVRAKSILNKAKEQQIMIDAAATQSITAEEEPLLKKIIALQTILASIELHHQPHLLANYTIELATLFHSYYNQSKILNNPNKEIVIAKLILVEQFVSTMHLCFRLMGISAPEKM